MPDTLIMSSMPSVFSPLAKALLDGFSGTIRRGEVVGLVGPNGAGKSTLLRAIMGEHPPAAGTLRIVSRLAKPEMLVELEVIAAR